MIKYNNFGHNKLYRTSELFRIFRYITIRQRCMHLIPSAEATETGLTHPSNLQVLPCSPKGTHHEDLGSYMTRSNATSGLEAMACWFKFSPFWTIWSTFSRQENFGDVGASGSSTPTCMCWSQGCCTCTLIFVDQFPVYTLHSHIPRNDTQLLVTSSLHRWPLSFCFAPPTYPVRPAVCFDVLVFSCWQRECCIANWNAMINHGPSWLLNGSLKWG